jgi:hypothetical protein
MAKRKIDENELMERVIGVLETIEPYDFVLAVNYLLGTNYTEKDIKWSKGGSKCL